MEDKKKKADLQSHPPAFSRGLSSTPGGHLNSMVCVTALFLASPHRPGCLSDWMMAHSSLHCHICHLQTEGTVFQLGTGRTQDVWQGKMECGGGENSITISPRSWDHPSPSSGCQWASLPPASIVSLKEKEIQHTHFPLLIEELKGCVIKPYMNLTT